MASDWRVFGADTIAYRLDKAELPGWIRKKVVVGPGEGALILRDGRPEELLTQSSQNVQDVLDSVVNKMLGWLTGQQDVQVIFIDLNAIRLPIFVGEARKQEQASDLAPTSGGWIHNSRASEVAIQAITADREIISAECIATVRLNPEDPARVAGLLQGWRGLSRWDLAAWLRDEVLSRVLIPHIAKVNSNDIRGNRDLTSSIASWVRAELETTLRNYGVALECHSVST